MNRSSRKLLSALLVFCIIVASCGSDDDAVDEANDDDQREEAGIDLDHQGEQWNMRDCRVINVPDHADDAPKVAAEYIVVEKQEGLVPDEAISELEAVGASEVELIGLVGSPERYAFPEGLTPDDYFAQIADSELFQSVNARVQVYEVADAELRDEALVNIRQQREDLVIGPLHHVGFLGHWGAFPATDPEICTMVGERKPSPYSEERVVGVVDTGSTIDDNVEAGGEDGLAAYQRDSYAGKCEVSHGEFVASVIKLTNPAAKVYATSAFPLVTDICWETDEAQILAATARLILDVASAEEELDAVNYSLGAEQHQVESDGEEFNFQAVLIANLIEALLELISTSATVFVAGGNTVPVPADPLAPARYHFTTAVGATDATDQEVIWVDKVADLAPPRDWIEAWAPGCDIVAQGTDDSSQVVIWSGSSFASPIAAAVGLTGQVMDSEFRDVLYTNNVPSPSQCERTE